ncbi:hypothetical protein PQ469_27680 [Mucilaginibacter sp. KACC 22773]|uniref:glycosyltransferase family 9 protein n=1 Tax=Mucilaginibacter sp. KACC 22773 TaxID=3025671 RepID=UPI0023652774|nr:hypothetical protein [Mucilaginibacter sp. KACC 22773]WDF77674.1 hypothetical protein PQ469_27680 [Mucilaginibacter sp. KACC 22773]
MEYLQNRDSDMLMSLASRKKAHETPDQIKNVLIVCGLSDLIIQCNVDIQMITQIYIPTYIFSHIKTNGTQITVLDETITNYNTLWKNNSAPVDFINPYLSKSSLDDIELLRYDLIIFYHKYEHELLLKLAAEIDVGGGLRDDELPLFTAMQDTNEKSRQSAFIGLNSFINTISFTPSEIEKIKKFKEILFSDYLGFNTLQQEALYHDLIETIVGLNTARSGENFKRILLLDDQSRKFYIGDTYFWLQNIRKNILSAYPAAVVIINCRSQEKIGKIKSIFSDDFDQRISIINRSLEELNFHDFDLVLCENDSVINLFSYIVATNNRFFEQVSLYSYVNTFIKQVSEYSTLNYKYLYDKRMAGADPIALILQNKRDAEIKLSEIEKNWAADWLVENGLKPGEILNVLVFNSSAGTKMLTEAMAIELIRVFGSKGHNKILLFDEEKQNLSLRLRSVLQENVWGKIMVFEGRGLRQAMGLMAHSQVKLIMGPCTGIMHLANGIYQHKLNKKEIKKAQLPALIVYTGNWKELQRYYHPKHWWTGTLIRCIVYSHSIDVPEGTFKDLALFDDEVESYCNQSLPLQQITISVFTSYFERYLLRQQLTPAAFGNQMV